MKWPSSITIIRHGQSAYNALRLKKDRDPLYLAFCEEYELGPSEKLRTMAETMQHKYALRVGDYETPLSAEGYTQARQTGTVLSQGLVPVPHVILVSPYLRTQQTLREGLAVGWPTLAECKTVTDDRIREQEHGMSLLYNDWRVFQSLHPEQRKLRELMGRYWYQYPQGESVSMVRDRIRSFTDMLIREYTSKDVMLVTHHMTTLSILANYDRFTPEQFIHMDEEEKPVNCGVSLYRGHANLGSNGKLELVFYNKKLY